MSYFIAHTITFSKDFKTFKVKGGDNNLIPRMNYWSNPIPIDVLYYNLNGGMITLTGTSEKNCFVRFLIKNTDFGGNWNDKTDYYHVKNDKNHADRPKLEQFDKMFIDKLIRGLKEIDNFERYIIEINDNYVYKANPTHAMMTRNIGSARKFTHYRAIEVANQYKHKNAKAFRFTETEALHYI